MDINVSGADIRSVCAEAGMFAIRARRKTVIEKDFLDAVTKVVKSYHKFSATPTYMVYNWSQQSGSGEISAVTGKQHYITDYRSYECSRYCFLLHWGTQDCLIPLYVNIELWKNQDRFIRYELHGSSLGQFVWAWSLILNALTLNEPLRAYQMNNNIVNLMDQRWFC